MSSARTVSVIMWPRLSWPDLIRVSALKPSFLPIDVNYYDQGVMDREKIQQDLKRYDERWPERHFWVAGKINVEPQSENRVRVTFPLGFKLRNGNKQSSGKVDKTLVLEPAGDDLQIVAVNERKAELGRINQEARKNSVFLMNCFSQFSIFSTASQRRAFSIHHSWSSWFPDRISYPRMNAGFPAFLIHFN